MTEDGRTRAGWDPSGAGVMRLPSGRLVRGRGLRHGLPAGPRPTFGVYLLAKQPSAAALAAPPPAARTTPPAEAHTLPPAQTRADLPAQAQPTPPAQAQTDLPPDGWEVSWVRWRDFWLPSDPSQALRVLREAWQRSLAERVELACGGGRGRTGTALACLAVIDGVPADQAVAYVRRHYHPRAVETVWQRRYVTRFPGR